ncbi:MAG: hypothetical protein LBS56_05965, partial [Propionibacteriaceae bacterium]|nr:hypothetical protein [Propionibacteriaceae bacterium]
MPDVRLALETIRAGAFALLHLGRDAAAARRAVADLYEGTNEAFGVVYAPGFPLADVDLPDQVDRVVLPWGMSVHAPESVERVWQVTSLAEGREAVAAGATAIAVKGSEAAGHVGPDSAFLLFQGLIGLAKEKGVKLYVHGGAGLHTSAAYWALGAQGVIMDSQVALFPETSIPRALRQTLLKLNGGETQLVGGTFRVLRWPAGPHLEPDATEEDALAHLDGLDIERNLLPTGQDFALAHEYVNRHTTLRFFVRAVKEAAYGHLRQAQANPAIRPHSPFAEALGVEHPIIQGPMARVSDEAKFLGQVSAAGALPSLALAMAADGAAQRLLDDASAALAGKPWSVGVIGFMQPQLVDDQIDRCLALGHKPTAAVIAGGRPAQAKRFESAGVRAFLHVQSPGLLDQFMKEGARNFIFEGRESGGHIGPTPSPLLWERMIVHLIDADDPAALTVVFAGGLHDALGSAFVSIMS